MRDVKGEAHSWHSLRAYSSKSRAFALEETLHKPSQLRELLPNDFKSSGTKLRRFTPSLFRVSQASQKMAERSVRGSVVKALAAEATRRKREKDESNETPTEEEGPRRSRPRRACRDAPQA